MTDLIYLTDSYKKELKTKVISCEKKGKLWEIVLEHTIFYPQGGGQLSDEGEIVGKTGTANVKHVRIHGVDAVHECSITGVIHPGEEVLCRIDWNLRFVNMRRHSGGHIIHEAVMKLFPDLKPLRAEHGKQMFIEYEGSLPIDKKYEIEKESNRIIDQNVPLKTEMVTYNELVSRVPHIAGNLPKNKPLRILTVGDFPPIPDGGTQVSESGEVGPVSVTTVENTDGRVRVYYEIQDQRTVKETAYSNIITGPQFIGELLEIQRDIPSEIAASDKPVFQLRLDYLGPTSEFAGLTKKIKFVPAAERQQVGIVINQVKQTLENAIEKQETSRSKKNELNISVNDETHVEDSLPEVESTQAIFPPQGHLHIVTQAIMEITRIFERISFTRVRHPEVDFDYYTFEALNMPQNHPARDEWETFFIDSKKIQVKNSILSKLVLSPHTSNGQVREMEKGKLPIRMINIAKCYRRQSDISHVPMFHQFEGMYIDRDVSIGHLKGYIDYFVKQFFGPERKSRLRPFHFQFTEPSFEVDITCGICNGKGCKFCKEGWLELAGSGMIHPNVLRYGGIDPNKYSGFAIGWGVERTYMMKSGTQLDDIRLLYGNDIRFLEQF
jgi:phenylalanyl-tRNA synthetase alpha chain